jgi:hypothetical protein
LSSLALQAPTKAQEPSLDIRFESRKLCPVKPLVPEFGQSSADLQEFRKAVTNDALKCSLRIFSALESGIVSGSGSSRVGEAKLTALGRAYPQKSGACKFGKKRVTTRRICRKCRFLGGQFDKFDIFDGWKHPEVHLLGLRGNEFCSEGEYLELAAFQYLGSLSLAFQLRDNPQVQIVWGERTMSSGMMTKLPS